MLLPFVLLVSVVAVQAQTSPAASPTPTPSPTPSLEHEFFKNILRDQKAIWTAPFHLERHDAKWMVPAGVGWMALVTTDRITGDEIGEANRQVAWSRHISNAGSVYSLAAAAGTFYFVGRAKDNYRARETGLLTAEAIIDSIIVEGGLKGITRRARPLDGRDRSEFFEGGSSFPSGHATQTWAAATVIANEYQGHRAVQIAAYSVATAVSIARFTGHKHYLSDVVAGSALGWGIGRYVYHAHHGGFKGPLITTELNRAAHQYGLGLTWNF
ncbi:MAG TPA: phosphatase PAP2 family protein [Pyrinomonadaceae bacterium]